MGKMSIVFKIKTKLYSGPASLVHIFNLNCRLRTIKQCKHSKGGVDVIMSEFNTQKNIIKCAQNIGSECSMCDQS